MTWYLVACHVHTRPLNVCMKLAWFIQHLKFITLLLLRAKSRSRSLRNIPRSAITSFRLGPNISLSILLSDTCVFCTFCSFLKGRKWISLSDPSWWEERTLFTYVCVFAEWCFHNSAAIPPAKEPLVPDITYYNYFLIFFTLFC